MLVLFRYMITLPQGYKIYIVLITFQLLISWLLYNISHIFAILPYFSIKKYFHNHCRNNKLFFDEFKVCLKPYQFQRRKGR